jgi:hypothetical protein
VFADRRRTSALLEVTTLGYNRAVTIRAVSLLTILFVSAALVAGEISVSPVLYTGAPSSQSEVQGASDGLNFLLAWRDFRDPLQTAIYASRVDARGRFLDSPTAIRIPAPLASPPVVAWTGSVYLIAWADIARMRFVRVDTGGQVLDLTPRDFGNIAARPVGAASCRNRAMIVYMGSPGARPPSNVHAALFDSDGNVVNRDITIGGASSGEAPVVACNGDNFYIAWRGFDGVAATVQGTLVSAQGEAGQTRTISSAVDGPMLASNGSDFLLAFTDLEQRLTVAHIDPEGVPTSTEILLPYSMSGRFSSFGNFMGRYRDGYLLAAYDHQQNPVGVVLDGAGGLAGEIALASGSVLLSNDRETLATWAETLVALDIFARIAGSEEAPTLLSIAAAQQTSARIASGGVCYLVVWLEIRGSDGGELRASRLALDGTQLDGEGIELADHIFAQPQVVFDGQYFVIAWDDGDAIRINRMMTNGLLLEGVRGRVAVEDHLGAFALGSNGRESLLVWTAPLNSTSFLPFLHAMRIATDSTFFPPIFLRMDVRAPLQPGVAGTPGEWLISWSDGQQTFSPNDHSPRQPPHILAARLNEKLDLLDPAPLPLATDDDVAHLDVAIAARDSDFLVTWDEAGRSGPTVHARAVALDGTLGNSESFGPGGLPSVTRGGDDFVIAWQDRGNLFYARFNHPELVIPLADSADEESQVALANGPDDALIAVYERLASEAVYGDISRSFARQFRIPRSEPRKRIVVH